MTMTPNELPQMYLLTGLGAMAVGTSIDALKARGTDRWNRFFPQDQVTVDSWHNQEDGRMVSWLGDMGIYKVDRA